MCVCVFALGHVCPSLSENMQGGELLADQADCLCAGAAMSQQMSQPQRVSLSRRPIKATEPFGSAVGGNSGKPSSLWSQASPLPVATPTGGKKGSSVDRRGSPVSGSLHSPKGT